MDKKFQNQFIGTLVLVLGLTLLGVFCFVTGEFLWAMLWPGVFLVFFVFMVDDKKYS